MSSEPELNAISSRVSDIVRSTGILISMLQSLSGPNRDDRIVEELRQFRNHVDDRLDILHARISAT